MRTSILITTYVATLVVAYPGMDKNVLKELSARATDQSTTLLGDLNNNSQPLSQIGNVIKSILTGAASAMSNKGSYRAPGPLGSSACSADKCCSISYIAQDMGQSFMGCTPLAAGAVRLGFHDAGAWEKNSPYGGADGSILLNAEEEARHDNLGLEKISGQMKAWYGKYQRYASMADMIQLGAILGTMSCPGGPRIKMLVGRPDDSRAAPPNLLPSGFDDANSLINMFQAKTFSAADLVALVGAHTISRQVGGQIDPSRIGAPQDTSSNVWDTTFYGQTLQGDNKTLLIFPSDKNLATSRATSGTWQRFAGMGGQNSWGPAFANAYFRMSLLGVKNLNSLTDCTNVLP